MGGPKPVHWLSTRHQLFALIVLHSGVLHPIPVVGPVRLYLTGLGNLFLGVLYTLSYMYVTHPIAAVKLSCGHCENVVTLPFPLRLYLHSEALHIIVMMSDWFALYFTGLGICSWPYNRF